MAGSRVPKVYVAEPMGIFFWLKEPCIFMGGGACQKYGFKREASRKMWYVKGGGVTKKFAFKFSSDSICNNASISSRMPKNSVS